MSAPFNVTVMLLLFIGIISYALGFLAANMAERRAKKVTDEQIRIITNQKIDLTEWVRHNWPNEYQAYINGHALGYQQGILDSPSLEEDNR